MNSELNLPLIGAERAQELCCAPHEVGDPQTLNRHRCVLAEARASLARRFHDGEPAHELVHRHAEFIDQLLQCMWRNFSLDNEPDMALIAVGGYGRGELHPWSDIDLLALTGETLPEENREIIGRFVTYLWDIGLHVGHSVRSLSQCVEIATDDVTVATALMEARHISGSVNLFTALQKATAKDKIWDSRAFFEAKVEEQRIRHRRWHDTAHNLEPNIKEGPGGLRDIQIIGWVAKRHFGAQTFLDLVSQGFLTQAEYDALDRGQNFLWRIRFALHLLAGRNEERLLFDHQRTLSEQFGYADDEHALAVEKFMKPYYRTIKELSRLSELLLELFQEALMFDDDTLRIIPINASFQSTNGFLDVRDEQAFTSQPRLMLELFLLLQERPDLQGVTATTIRLLRDHRDLIDEQVRSDARARATFMSIIAGSGQGPVTLRRMHRYGILGRYLPVFGNIEGQMQHDLFHAYTVDEHSLFVVENLRKFGLASGESEFPLAANIFKQLQKPELLYLAGLFHDVAKGRGGDHSELGAEDAEAFCLNHDISPYDARIVSWLVKNHLIMSVTAQRQDITDPDVINRFAIHVGNQLHLDYLYLLTIADIRGTNPTLWNDWKDTLLKDLYEATEYALARGLENPLAKSDLIQEAKSEARRLLTSAGATVEAIDGIWHNLPDNYFLRTDPEQISWHSRAIMDAKPSDLPVVLLRDGHGGTEGFVYTYDQDSLFAALVSTLDRLGLTILQAAIITTLDGRTLDSFVVLESDASSLSSLERVEQIRSEVAKQLVDPTNAVRESRRRAARQLQHFSIRTQVRFEANKPRDRTMMEVITVDRPGLLSRISWALVDCDVKLQNAKIATFGERVEDIFYVTDRDDEALSAEHCERLRQSILNALESNRH